MEWVSVDERLPEKNQSVFCCNINGISYDEREAVVGFLETDGIWYEPWKPWRRIEVTHWMPLPEPPNK